MVFMMAILYLEAHRVKATVAEPCCCCCQIGFCCCCLPDDCACSPKPQPEPKWKADDMIDDFINSKYTTFVCHPAVFSFSAAFIGLAIGLSIWSIAKKDIGYNPSMIAHKEKKQYHSMKAYFENFNTFPSFLFFWDLDVPASQTEMIDLYGNVTATQF